MKTTLRLGVVLGLVTGVIASVLAARSLRTASRGAGELVPLQSTITWENPETDAEKKLNTKNAIVRFELVNRGGTPVRIISIASGCGCATPTVHPTTVNPQAKAFVDVEATSPAVGERTVPITLHTDSSTVPDVPLQLRIRRRRTPPYLVQARGDLVFRKASSLKGETREIVVVAAETRERTKRPILRVDVPYLQIHESIVNQKQYSELDIYERTYHYKVEIVEDPPPGRFAGEMLIIDPWSGNVVERMNVFGERVPPIRALPPRLLISDENKFDDLYKIEFLIATTQPVDKFRVESVVDPRFGMRVDIQREEANQLIHKCTLVISPKLHKMSDSITLHFEDCQDGARSVDVPVTIRLGPVK